MDVPNLVHADELTLAGTLSHREAPRGRGMASARVSRRSGTSFRRADRTDTESF